MHNEKVFKGMPVVLGAIILAFLLCRFGSFIQPTSFDLAQHYFLVDEIMKYGGVRSPAPANLMTMAIYPPIAHWLAAIVGWVGGSGLVGIELVTIASVFGCYVLIGRLVSRGSPWALFVFAILFAVLIPSASQIGWEVVGNFFYPQLVGDVVYFGLLLWMCKVRSVAERAAMVIVVGALTMWLQPLVAIHILVAGMALLLVIGAAAWRDKQKVRGHVLGVLAIAVAAVLLVLLHPSFKLMRNVSAWDGGLVLGYTQIMPVTAVCGLIGLISCGVWIKRRHDIADAVLGSSLVAAASLAILQNLLWIFHAGGSPYAIKKHMFIVVTLASMNAARLLALAIPRISLIPRCAPFTIPTAAGAASLVILSSFTTPVGAILAAIDYADYAVHYGFPEYKAGNLADADESQSITINALVTMSALEHPFDEQGANWLMGRKPFTDGVQYAMVRNTAPTKQRCPIFFAKTPLYMIVPTSCLRK